MTTIRRPPGPVSSGLLGQSAEYAEDSPGFLLRLASTYGDVVRFRLALMDVYLLNHPEYVQKVLVSDRECPRHLSAKVVKLALGKSLLTHDGDEHRTHRRLVGTAFRQERIAAYADMMTSHTMSLCDKWETALDGTHSVDIVQEMMQLTLGVIGKVLFDEELDESRRLHAHMSEVLAMVERIVPPSKLLTSILPLPRNLRFLSARASLKRLIASKIRSRMKSDEDRQDVLSVLLAARGDDGQRELSLEQIRDEMLALFWAGHETSAIALSWTWYLLSEHPEVEAHLHDELTSELGGRTPTADDLPRLMYTRRVLTEAMRLYPPAYIVERRTTRDMEFGGYVVPAGKTILLSPYAMHHDSRYYPDPERFDPDRWLPAESAKRPRYAYFPFGAGPHKCVGEPLASMELVLVTAVIAQRWTMRLVPGHPVKPQPLVTLRPKQGLRMILEARRQEPLTEFISHAADHGKQRGGTSDRDPPGR